MRETLVILAILTFLVGCGVALAHEGNQPLHITLGIPEPKVLPGSFFYFFKDLGRGFKMFFTFDVVKKTELELHFADEKLAEAEKLMSSKPDKKDALEKALQNYLDAQEQLEKRLASLQGKNKNVDQLLEKLAERVIEHQKLFDELEEKIAKEKVERLKKEIANVTKKALELDESKFKEKLKAQIKKDETDDEEELEILEKLDEELNEALDDVEEELEKTGKLEEKKDAEEELEESKKDIGELKKKIEAVKPSTKNISEARRLLTEAEKHWGFAKTAFDKEDYASVETHVNHIEEFLDSLGSLLEPKEQKTEEKFQQKCVSAGCSGELCVSEAVKNTMGASICIFKPEFMCYQRARCEVQPNGKCGWAQTQELTACIANAKAAVEDVIPPPPPSPAPTPPPSPPAATEIKLEADDGGFYPSTILSLTKGEKVKLTFVVRTTGVYYAGLDFRSPKFKTESVKPGGSTMVEFTANESFTITSYWPASGVRKADLKVEVK